MKFALCIKEMTINRLVGQMKGLKGPLFARVAMKPEEPPRVLPLRDGVALKERFRAAIGVKA